MRFTNNWVGATVASLFLLGAIGCSSAHKEKKPQKSAARPTKLIIRQTGSNLTREVTLSDDEDSEAKAAKRKKKESVDQDYVPRGGFR